VTILSGRDAATGALMKTLPTGLAVQFPFFQVVRLWPLSETPLMYFTSIFLQGGTDAAVDVTATLAAVRSKT
jgi:hypothetical protein